MGRSAHGKRRIGSRYSNDTMVWLGALVAATAVLAPAQPVTVAVVDTGANVRVPEIAAKRPATYDVRTRGRDVRDLNGHGALVASIVARSSGNARLLIIRAGKLERRVQRRERSCGGPVRGRPRCSHRQPQPGRAAHVDGRTCRHPIRDHPQRPRRRSRRRRLRQPSGVPCCAARRRRSRSCRGHA
jgi:hypothetical protein